MIAGNVPRCDNLLIVLPPAISIFLLSSLATSEENPHSSTDSTVERACTEEFAPWSFGYALESPI